MQETVNIVDVNVSIHGCLLLVTSHKLFPHKHKKLDSPADGLTIITYQSFCVKFLLYMWPEMFLYGGQIHLQRMSSKFCDLKDDVSRRPKLS